MQLMQLFTQLIIMASFLILIAFVTFLGARIQFRGWKYYSKNQALQKRKNVEKFAQLVTGLMFVFWFPVWVFYVQNILLFVLGYLGIVIAVAFGGAVGSMALTDILHNILNYNFKINSNNFVTVDSIDFSISNKKKGERYE